MGLDHLEKAAEFFPRVDVGNECWWLLRHYRRKRGCGDITTAQSILEEAPQAAQLEEPRRGHRPAFAQKSIHMLRANTGNASSRAAGTAESPENYRIADE
jgi:hypothetical protein